MNRRIMQIVIAICLLALPGAALAHPHILRTVDDIEVTSKQLIEDLKQVQVIFMGELHDNDGHHQAQLNVIKALVDDEKPLVIGLEMFRADSQKVLDRWTNGEITRAEFMEAYFDNWSMWPQYQEIFDFARNRQINMIGLNIPRELTAKVARNGFDSLTEEQRQMLGNVQCIVDPTYGDYIRKAMGGHGGHGQQYLYFCEAQLLWDTMMATHVVRFLKENPDARVVVLAGSGHAWKFGIPRQMLDQADISYRVVLPEIFGRIDRLNVSKDLTDYLWLDVGADGWDL